MGRIGRGTRIRISICAFALSVLTLSACAPSDRPAPETIQFETAAFTDLPGWNRDDHRAALTALLRSCPRLEKRGAGRFGKAGVWRTICASARSGHGSRDGARKFFERYFVPALVQDASGDPSGLITGYYEPELQGARKRSQRFDVPLHTRPPELVSVDLGRFRSSLRGERITGRVVKGALLPYHDRGRIEDGALNGRDLELVWVDSAADAFFLHIQGSGRIRLRDGTVMRVGYAASNGQPYSSIGRELIRQGAIGREAMSMQAIRKWLADNPRKGDKLMRTNRSYIFFRRLTSDGPIGAAGVVLTPERSIAVDRRLLPLGLPVWLDTVLPDRASTPWRRLMIAQDTGGAIRGAVRADIFWGAGKRAAEIAGRLKSPGRYWILQPRKHAPTG